MDAAPRLLFRRPAMAGFARRLASVRAASPAHLAQAQALRESLDVPLEQILAANGWADPNALQDELAREHGLATASFSGTLPNARLLSRKPARFWLRHAAVPWMQLGERTVVAVSRPDELDSLRSALRHSFGQIHPVLVPEAQIMALLAGHFRTPLACEASTRVPAPFSCRTMRARQSKRGPALLLALAAGAAALAPAWAFTVLCLLAMIPLVLFTALKLCGFAAHLSGRARANLERHAPPARLPRISVMVPLFREAEISRELLRRMCRLTYPRALLDVLLVLEESDDITRQAVSRAELPPWMKVIEVPADGPLTTKPRALNYALNFCRGEIIGVWDAEDAPEPRQLEKVAAAFAASDARTACFQGALDFYNPRANWIARCFTLEYSSWFRVVLDGIARMGLVVPLGGTTMFIRRRILDEVGGWDAHNVTEDADLGVRLARMGYTTRMLPAATYEEANCRPWPWVKQRSRWLKGFMVTYLVHMRSPGQLRRDLGWRRFLGFQAFFLGTIGQFLLAPVLWSFWLLALGLPHPSATILPPAVLTFAAAAMVFFELLGICICAAAARAMGRPLLALWAPVMMLYFPMGVLAVSKALYEVIFRPFFWDKTAHGLHGAAEDTPADPA